jgi:hypothetical protein
MRKVLAKNPHIEQQKLHRRVFFEKIDPKNQALMVIRHYLLVEIPLHNQSSVKTVIMTGTSFLGIALLSCLPKTSLPYIVIFGLFIVFYVNLAFLLFILPNKLTFAVRNT